MTGTSPPHAPAPAPRWPWNPFLFGLAVQFLCVAASTYHEPGLIGRDRWSKIEISVIVAVVALLGSLAIYPPAALALLPFAGPGELPDTVRRLAAAGMRSAWFAGAAVSVLVAIGQFHEVTLHWAQPDEYGYRDPSAARLHNAVGFAFLGGCWAAAAAGYPLLVLRGLNRDDLPGGSADAATVRPPPRCGCGYPSLGLDPAGRCPECGRPLLESRRVRLREEERRGPWRWWAVLGRTVREPSEFFSRLPMWSGHAASRSVLAWSCAAAGTCVGTVVAVAATVALTLYGGLEFGLFSGAGLFVPVAAGTALFLLLAASATAWGVWLVSRLFLSEPLPLASAGRVAAYLSPMAAVTLLAWAVALAASVGTTGWGVIVPGSISLLGTAMVLSLLVRLFRAVGAVRCATE